MRDGLKVIGAVVLSALLVACSASDPEPGAATSTGSDVTVADATEPAQVWDRDTVLAALTDARDQVATGDLTEITRAIDGQQHWCVPVDVLYYCALAGWAESPLPGWSEPEPAEPATNPDGSDVPDGDLSYAETFAQFQRLSAEEQQALLLTDLEAAAGATGKALESHYLAAAGPDLDPSFYTAFPDLA
ncbi:hypothetical protein [Occultella aeris]|nr:hypothetical protein [Occultella aeris]